MSAEQGAGTGSESPHTTEAARGRLAKRHAREKRFRAYGVAAIATAMAALALLLGSIALGGLPGFFQHTVELDVTFAPDLLDPDGTGEPSSLARGDHAGAVKRSLRERFPDASSRRDKRALYALVSRGAGIAVRDALARDPALLGQVAPVEVLLSDDADRYFKGEIEAAAAEQNRKLSDAQIGWLDALDAEDRVRNTFHTRLLTAGDSREPELAGIWGATVGSFLTLLVTLALSFPVGVATAIYLEEFAPRNRWTDFVEVNINNLAAVPSIVFGLLGLAVFLNFVGMPRSAPVVGGFVLALMTLPTIIIAARSAIASVPPSIREAALGVGASPTQVVFQHVLPLAMPGVLTGTILGMARALGETAPLLMIGMVAFIVDVPSGLTSPATVLPVQVFLWADSPERAFVAKTSAAILVLLSFLVLMNLAAVLLRNRFERRW